MGIGMSIVFTGLCALVADGDRGPAHVLLVDAQGIGEVGGVVLPEHAPTLVVSLSSLANAETSQPTRVVAAWPGQPDAAAGAFASDGLTATEQLGLWDLRGTRVRIRIQEGTTETAGLRLYHPPAGTSSWPAPPRNFNDPAAWRDVRFLADMKALAGDGRIAKSLVDPDTVAARSLPSAVASSFAFEAGLMEAGIPSQPLHRDDVFEFRDGGNAPKLRQALTDTMRWSLEAKAGAIVVEIVPDDDRPVKRLVFASSATRHRIFVSNLPAENGISTAHHAMNSEEMAALHFGAYYKLLQSAPADGALPRRWAPPLARGEVGMMSTTFCPPALFTRR